VDSFTGRDPFSVSTWVYIPKIKHHPGTDRRWKSFDHCQSTHEGFQCGVYGRVSYNIVKDPVHVRDFQATLPHLFGIDHERFSYKF
jgi:hypothetical protein